ncbi:hypothetical protein [Desulfovibrio sp. TomC]|uniref:hypothetical protein n=1 Tax=Desulfovibrio sp. TomC TaxID=1562888 RepID=UPI0005733D05|nr:hypothetical protein [Desulfovibrio sp. TomC]KHK02972.1 hypothetical protein NY78_1501 [Desulfovibrio sp. TomC]
MEMEREKPWVAAGLEEVGLPGRVARSDRLFFHAAVYSNFARDRAMADALEAALCRPEFERLDVVSLDPVARPPYWDEFRQVLRQDMTASAMQREFSVSASFLDALASRHPHKVRLFVTIALPLVPVLVLGDAVIAGHYAHSPVAAPLGLWLVIPTDAGRLLELAEEGSRGDALEPVDAGAYRLVCDCLAARAVSRRLA